MADWDYLDIDDVYEAGRKVLGFRPELRDYGLLDSAVARPQASAFGQDAYESLFAKAAALMQGLVANHPFVDGNKRIGWACMELFLGLNGSRLPADLDVDRAERFTLLIAAGELTDIGDISIQLYLWSNAAAQQAYDNDPQLQAILAAAAASPAVTRKLRPRRGNQGGVHL